MRGNRRKDTEIKNQNKNKKTRLSDGAGPSCLQTRTTPEDGLAPDEDSLYSAMYRYGSAPAVLVHMPT